MYGQKNYLEIMGINGKYRISQIGCFLVAFSNLSKRFGHDISPVKLNAAFRDRNIYRDVDDGIRDDLGYEYITKYNKNIVVAATGNGKPTHDNTIVKFYFKGNSGFNTHFSLVHDASKGLIVDSWDGQIKSWDRYGGPITWAKYIDKTPKPVTKTVTAKPKTADTVIVQKGWGISHVAKDAGYADYKDRARWDYIAKLNGHKDATTFRIYPNQVVKVTGSVPVTKTPAAPVATPTPAPAAAIVTETGNVPVTVVPTVPDAWKETFVIDEKVYNAIESATIKDFGGVKMDIELIAGQKVNGMGTFKKGSITYVRTRKSVENGWWYGVDLDILSAPQEPTSYVGTLSSIDDDELFSLDMNVNDTQGFGDLSFRERLVGIVASLQGFLLRGFSALNIGNKNKENK